jgi:hypothetical protein
MARFIVALLFFFIGNIEAQAQSGWEYLDDSPERLVGLLDLEDIVAFGCGPAPKRATTRAFGAASQTASVIGTIYMREGGDAGCGLMIERAGGIKEEVPTMESGYEIPAAMVYERRGQWFRIRLKTGSAWIRRNNADEFLPYPEMLNKHLAYLPQGWDGVLRETPGTAGRLKPLTPGWRALLDRGLSIEYLGSQRVGNDLWVHIRLAAKASCDQVYEGVTDVEGWIPAYRPTRSPSLWFSSRGC